MVNTENPAADRIVAEKWVLWRESFRMAKLLLQEQEPKPLEDREAKEHYYASIPMVAMTLQEQMLGGSHFISQAPERDQIERYEHALAVVASMKKANDAVEKKGGHE